MMITMASCCAPMVETCGGHTPSMALVTSDIVPGLVLSKIRVRHHKMSDGVKDADPEALFIA